MNLDAILGERLAILGGTGSGKSYAARGLAERILARGDRLGVIDPTGVWWGLRSEFPVVLFGGDHADLPLTEHAGRVVAQAVATSQQSWIIDTSALQTKAAERRFMLDFLDSLFGANRAPITLIVDEADRFSPQRMSPESTRLHERMEEIVRRGRVRGFTPWLITQRPASLNKDVLSQATALICMRMTGAQDRSAIGDVIEGQADKATAKAIIDAMPRHKVGEGMVWAPMQDILLPAKFPKIKTFDSMSADTAHKHIDQKLPPIDVDSLKEKLASVEVETKANDPAALRKRIKELEADVARKPAEVPNINAELQAAHADGRRQGFAEGAAAAAARLKVIAGDIERAQHAIGLAAQAATSPLPTAPPGAATPSPGIVHRQAPYVPAVVTPAVRAARQPAGGDVSIPRGEKACLICIAQQANGATREQLTVVTGYKRSSRDAYIQRLREKGYIDQQGDRLLPTPEGVAALGTDYEPLPTGAALRAFHLQRLPDGERRVLEMLIEAYPAPVQRDAIDGATGYKRSSRDAYLQRLSARQLITVGRGEVRASEELFS